MTEQDNQRANAQPEDGANDEPQVFAVEKDLNGGWKYNRRGFLATMGTAAAASVAARMQPDMARKEGDQVRSVYAWQGSIMRAHGGKVLALAMRQDGTILASASDDETAKLWTLPDGALFDTLTDHNQAVTTLAISPGGGVLASAGLDNRIGLYSLPNGKLLTSLTGHTDEITALVVSPDNTLLVSASKDGTARLWSLPDGRNLKILGGHAGPVNALAISPDGGLLATGSQDGTVKLWSLPAGDLLATLEGYSDEETWYVTATERMNIRDQGSLSGNVVGAANPGDLVQVLDTENDWHKIRQADGSIGHIAAWFTDLMGRNLRRLVMSPDGTQLFGIGQGGTVRVWSLPDGAAIDDLVVGQPISTLAVSPQGSMLAAASSDGPIKLWSLSGSKSDYTLTGHTKWINALVFSPDGGVLASGSYDQMIKLWSTSSGDLLHTLEGHTDHVNVLEITPDGKLLCSASSDNTIRLWSVMQGKLQTQLTDMAVNYDTVQGVVVEIPAASTGLDQGSDFSGGGITGGTITFTLPCGSAIPAGAVCVCNCVAGSIPTCACHAYVAPCTCDSVCTCDTHTAPCTCDSVCTCDGVCSCDGHGTYCSCDKVCTCDTVHYWFPN